MAKACVVTGKSSLVGGKYANRTRATVFTPTGSIRRYANLQKKRIFVPELNKNVLVTISPQGLRTIKKNGAYNTLVKAGAIR